MIFETLTATRFVLLPITGGGEGGEAACRRNVSDRSWEADVRRPVPVHGNRTNILHRNRYARRTGLIDQIRIGRPERQEPPTRIQITRI